MGILHACLDAIFGLDQAHAIIFSAANDIDKKEEYNPGFSAYSVFLEKNLLSERFNQEGSIHLNTQMLYPKEFKYRKEA